ncbi:DUF5709 domain-containing protein [Planomonospora venezuelensis]|uniref:DUF5709 domain-containing protein n=1 Tax=Planomonospora venezuelensis TaxID=1999 RepID=A0A841DC77_PLAVE|nr:DUF5709 domain-containing protein [Planomonospora venezuelensis]MBB5966064.1 hypothetical protein [Planomonospora venezuelensis]GIN03623.1 hypothetical protein Pve01_52810 [Planomonospora venezuelensis]
MREHTPEHDPHSRFEDEGIPDLQDGTPQQQWAVDPQEAPLPGDRPMAVDDFGTTVDEQIQGESLEGRISREVPEEQPMFGVADEPAGGPRGDRDDLETGGADELGPRVSAEGGLGVGSDLDTGYEPDTGAGQDWSAQPEEPSGAVWDEPRRAGRLVAADEGVREDAEADLVADEVGPDAGGYSAEEAAMRVEPE